jgi:hypothetical protein
MRSTKQKTNPSPKELWVGMPEFNQPDIKPAKSIKVNFVDNEAMLKFSKLIGQQITAKTRSVWFPQVPQEPFFNKRYTDKKKK